MTWQKEIEELAERIALAHRMGGPERVARQHEAGRLTVRERIARMLDPDSFQEIGAIAGRPPTTPTARSSQLHSRQSACSAAARSTAGRW